MPISFTWNKSDLQRACHPLTPRRRSHLAKFRLPRIWPAGALGVLGQTSLCPRTVWQLLCWQLPLEPSSKKVHVGITHTCQPRAWVGDEHPPLLWALHHGAALRTRDAPSCAGRQLPSRQGCWWSLARLFVICQGALPASPHLPLRAHWLSSQLNEALNQGIIQL